jgi:hypothetical protein
MLDQAINQGHWRGGGKLRLTNEPVASGDVQSDFWAMAKAGRIPWLCKDCLKNKKKGECTCEIADIDN